MIPPVLAQAVEATTPTAPPLVYAASPGAVEVDGRRYVNLACCDYLGLARHPQVLAAAAAALDQWGLGAAAARSLSGNTVLHRQLETRLAAFVGCEDAVLHGSCWTANTAVFGALAELAHRSGTTLAIFSDRLNHASLIDGIRTIRSQVSHLSTYDHPSSTHPGSQDSGGGLVASNPHGNLPGVGVIDGISQLHQQLQEHAAGAARVIVTDGVFSMEGDQAPLRQLIDLAHEFEALLVVDDSHGTGVLGDRGRGSVEAQHVLGEVDVITGTLGKALGGAIGGFVAGSTAFTTAVRALSRPYVFSNNPPYPVVAASLAALDVIEADPGPLTTLRSRVGRLRAGVDALGLDTLPGDHPIVPLLIGPEDRAGEVSHELHRAGVYATPIAFPMVGRGEARIRMQVSAAHTTDDIDRVLEALTSTVGRLARP